ncbi:MAG TPA: TonB-dependent receptor [Vicinamibacterales bacterium]|nr:TonB-dependent receptor [Vicinamibacterales bacterium]
MRRLIFSAITALTILFAFGLTPAAAQTGQMFGELVGRVVDDQGGALPGVNVTLSGPAVMGTPTATTSATGQYRFPAVNSGTYTLKFELAGFAPLTREGIVVPVRQTITVDATLKLASLQETVTVSGASPTVDVENTKVGARLDQEILKDVPTSRTIFGSTTVLPGMTMGRQDPGGLNAATSTGMAAHGASNYNLNYYGVTADTPQNYGSMYYMDFGSAEEISVDTAAMGAEVGGGGGANINVIPKSGSNALKGTAVYSVTGKGYANWFTGNNVTPELRNQGISDPSLQKLYDFNADAGGPFIKDRLWWFGSFRNYHTIEATPNYTTVNADGSLTNPFESNLRNYTTSGKYQISKNNQLSAFWTYNKKFQPHRNAGCSSTSCQSDPVNTLNQQSPKNLINGNWTSVMGQNTFLEVSSTYFHMHWPSDWSDEFKALPADLQLPSTFNNTTKAYIAGPEPTGQRFRDAYRQQQNIGVTRYIDGWLGASHQLKTGFENWYGWGQDYYNIFQDTRLRYTSSLDGSNLKPLEIFEYNTPLTQKSRMRNFAAFVQDRATYQRVTLNLGLRYSYFDGNIPAQTGGGGNWFPVTNYPQIDPGYKWSTFAPRTGVVFKLTEDGKNVAKASYSRYYESMYTTEFSSINPNSIQTGGVATYAWNGALNANGTVPASGLLNANGTVPAPGVAPTPKSVFSAKANSIDPNLRDPKDDEIMFAYQREIASNFSFNVDWIQRWFHDVTADQDCYGLPCSTVASTVYTPFTVVDPGPDNIKGTSDDRSLMFYNVLPQYVGKDTFFHTNCGNNVTVSCVQRYKALELSFSKRMSNRWQMQGSYVWSRLNGDQPGIGTGSLYDYTNPNNLLPFVIQGTGANNQPHAFKLLGSYQAPLGITLGANYQALSGLPRDRNLTVPFAQGSTAIRVESRGTYQYDTLSLLSLRADKSFRISGPRRASFVVELHNALNSSSSQNSVGTATQSFASQAAFDAVVASNLTTKLPTSYFGRVQEIVAPRVLKIGFKFDF